MTDINNKTFRIISLILNKYLFNKYVLDALTKILNTRVFFKIEESKLQPDGLWKHIEIINFFNIFGVKCAELNIIGNHTYLNLYKLEVGGPKEEFSGPPEVLVVFPHSHNKTVADSYKPLLDKIDKSQTSNFELNDRTTFDGTEYVLDTIILNNFNGDKKHTVILSKNSKFNLLYTGLPSKPVDDIFVFNSQNNCKIRHLDKDKKDFKIDDKCNLNYGNCKDYDKYCYSLNLSLERKKGDKTFIYVINNDKLLKSKTRHKEYNNIRDMDNVVRDIYDLDNMSKDELIYELNDRYRVFLLPDFDYTTEQLREVLKDTIKSYFNEKNKSNISSMSLSSSNRRQLMNSI